MTDSEEVPGVGALLPDDLVTRSPVPAFPTGGFRLENALSSPGLLPFGDGTGVVRVSRTPPTRVPEAIEILQKPAPDPLTAGRRG